MSGAIRTLAAAGVFLCIPPLTAWAGGGQKSIARSFLRAAKKAGVRRVAVLPFRPLDGSSAAQGRLLAEELTTRLARGRAVSVVERSWMDALMSEHRLGRSGVLAEESLTRIGRLLQAEAVVVGSFAAVGDALELHVRLIEIETGVVLCARRKRVKAEPFAGDGFASSPAFVFPEEEAAARGPGWTFGPPAAVAEAGCEAAERRVNALVGGILDLKARYWAEQARKSGLPRGILSRTGASIPDPVLRAWFYRLVTDAFDRRAPSLSATEMKRFMAADREAFILGLSCVRASPRTAAGGRVGKRYARGR
ncbi:MAG: FlgO family outer membrane protein [Elusimicrobiota bacterium]